MPMPLLGSWAKWIVKFDTPSFQLPGETANPIALLDKTCGLYFLNRKLPLETLFYAFAVEVKYSHGVCGEG